MGGGRTTLRILPLLLAAAALSFPVSSGLAEKSTTPPGSSAAPTELCILEFGRSVGTPLPTPVPIGTKECPVRPLPGKLSGETMSEPSGYVFVYAYDSSRDTSEDWRGIGLEERAPFYAYYPTSTYSEAPTRTYVGANDCALYGLTQVSRVEMNLVVCAIPSGWQPWSKQVK
jgi:hypothetical protein